MPLEVYQDTKDTEGFHYGGDEYIDDLHGYYSTHLHGHYGGKDTMIKIAVEGCHSYSSTVLDRLQAAILEALNKLPELELGVEPKRSEAQEALDTLVREAQEQGFYEGKAKNSGS